MRGVSPDLTARAPGRRSRAAQVLVARRSGRNPL